MQAMQNPGALHVWVWQLFTNGGEFESEPLTSLPVELHRYNVKMASYKLVLLLMVDAAAYDNDLEFSLSTRLICEKTGLNRVTVRKVIEAALRIGHIVATHKITPSANPDRRTRIYRLAIDPVFPHNNSTPIGHS